jgi:GGDEF domain-containing protein
MLFRAHESGFAALLVGVSESAAAALADQVRQALERGENSRIIEKHLPVRIDVTFVPVAGDSANLAALLRDANARMSAEAANATIH